MIPCASTCVATAVPMQPLCWEFLRLSVSFTFCWYLIGRGTPETLERHHNSSNIEAYGWRVKLNPWELYVNQFGIRLYTILTHRVSTFVAQKHLTFCIWQKILRSKRKPQPPLAQRADKLKQNNIPDGKGRSCTRSKLGEWKVTVSIILDLGTRHWWE